MTFTPKTQTLSGADEHAPSFSTLALMEQAAAEGERDALLNYDRLQEERIKAVRETGMRALRMEAARTKEQRERAEFLEKQLADRRRGWLGAFVFSGVVWGIVYWVVTR